MKTKVGILTTYFASNYGAMLQCFALKVVLEQMDCDVEVIRYKQRSVYDYYNPFSLLKFVGPKLRIHPNYFLRYFPTLAKREIQFRKFSRKFINEQTGFSHKIPEDKDLYIVGSDQLWKRFLDGNFDPIYMGYFKTNPKAKKITYAVSGENIVFDADTTKYLKNAVCNFDLISMREANIAQRYREAIPNIHIDVTLDPTLLAEASIYKNIPHTNPLHSQKYVLFYSIRQQNMAFLKKIHSFAEAKGVKLLVLSEGYEVDIEKYAQTNSDVIYLPTAGIDVFLGAIENAEYVFTPSFHGTVFSILYHKNFYNMLLDDGHDTRGINLLKQFNLSECHIKINDEIIDKEIDYRNIDSSISEKRTDSINFIKRAINLKK